MHVFASAVAGAICLCSCVPDAPSDHTPETKRVEQSLADFQKDPSTSNKLRVEKDLKNLEAKIDRLQIRVSKLGGAEKSKVQTELDNARIAYDAYQSQLTGAKISATVGKAGEAIKDAAESAGESFQKNTTNHPHNP